ncbi:MAG: UDP-N-acetylmuramoyl-tripeptide--D-alanyl-D-alanine ligase [Gemmatimonadota bacterium]
MTAAAFGSDELRRIFGLPRNGTDSRFTSVSTDTRDLKPGSLFIALRGERFDGADFLEEAAARGALGAVVPRGREDVKIDLEWFPVADPARALADLAAHYRMRRGARVVGVTGSSGKTTVKEMIGHALGGVLRVHRTRGNLNNQIGVPLSILAAPEEAEVWVLELGSSAPGEIARLAEISAPDDAVVTTVGPAHLEGLGDEIGVMAEKMALLRGAAPEGAVVVGEIPAVLPKEARRLRRDTVVAGLGPACDFVPDRWHVGPAGVAFERRGVEYRVGVGGEHHLRDALLAAAVAESLGVPAREAALGLANYRPVGMRGALRQLGRLTVVADCYNANPESFEAAIRYCIEAFPGRRLTAAVGSMLELGARAAEAHRAVAKRIVEAGFELVVATGDFREAFESISRPNGTTVLQSEGPEDMWAALGSHLTGEEVVLVKASRGVRLERVVERLEEQFGGATG